MMSQWCKGRYVIGAQGGVMIVVDSESLNVLNIIKMVSYLQCRSFSFTRLCFKGYSSRTCVWDGVHLVVPSESGTLTWVNIDTGIVSTAVLDAIIPIIFRGEGLAV